MDWINDICHEIIREQSMRAIEFPCCLSNVSDGSWMQLSKLPGDHLNDSLGMFHMQIGEKYTPSQAVIRLEKVDQLLAYCRFAQSSSTMHPEHKFGGVSNPVRDISYNIIPASSQIFIAQVVWVLWKAAQHCIICVMF